MWEKVSKEGVSGHALFGNSRYRLVIRQSMYPCNRLNQGRIFRGGGGGLQIVI